MHINIDHKIQDKKLIIIIKIIIYIGCINEFNKKKVLFCATNSLRFKLFC